MDLLESSASWDFLVAQTIKSLTANAGDARAMGSIPGMGRFPGEGNGNPLQYSCLGNPTDRGAWWTTVHGVTKRQTHLGTQLNTCTGTDTHTCILIRPAELLSVHSGMKRGRGSSPQEPHHPQKYDVSHFPVNGCYDRECSGS